MKRSSPVYIAVVLLAALFIAGCVSAPEHCHGCLTLLSDGGGAATADRDGGTAATGGMGGGAVSTGGVIGGGGMAETGGAIGSGGTTASGGMTASSGGQAGGTTTGGVIGSGGTRPGTGGAAPTGGMPGTGGVASGGTAGAATGGMGTGGAAMGGMGMGGMAAGGGGAGGDPDLVLWYKFDESGGTMATDSAMWGGIPRNGTVNTVGGASASFSTTHVQVGTHALSLGGGSSTVGGYVSVPSVPALAPTAMTISAWVYLNANSSSQNWERVFDFGANTTAYMFLTVRAGDSPNPVRFGITTNGNGTDAEQRLSSGGVLSTGTWHHVAVILAAGTTYTGRLYIDNVQVATNSSMTLHAGDLGATSGNYLGRSQYAADPYFNGYIDDFRVYKRALTPPEIAALNAIR